MVLRDFGRASSWPLPTRPEKSNHGSSEHGRSRALTSRWTVAVRTMRTGSASALRNHSMGCSPIKVRGKAAQASKRRAAEGREDRPGGSHRVAGEAVPVVVELTAELADPAF